MFNNKYYGIRLNGGNAMSKMGRPNIEKPKNKIVGIRFTEEEHKMLIEYCQKNNQTITQVVIDAVKKHIADNN